MKGHFKTTQFNQIFKEYKNLIKLKQYQSGQMYTSAIKEFLTKMEQRGITNVEDINSEEMNSYYDYLISRPNRKGGTLSDNTINHHLFGISLLFQYLLDTEILQSTVKIPKFLRGNTNTRDILSREEVKELYQHCKNKKERTVLTLAYGCGLRRSEIEQLQTSDLRLTKGFLIVRKGKNSKRREVPLSESVIEELKNYLMYERSQFLKQNITETTFLLNTWGKPMRGRVMNKILQELIERTGNPEIQSKSITLHSLRHSIATHLADNGAGLEFIKDFLGHSRIDTSHLYAIRRKRQTKIK